ncbi:MAG: MerR family transcriptional regulator [Bacteroidota bacterium]|nr:MerR family transcriptional regulator [Flavisolibacter sp.]MBD0286681.1 MerR family transcriptional regulator [Flavisolibacter sp.]MBD0296896.1 MerR family transcriptional regulator [Flavisolibacter sp.]MBD0352543.1 MerR family transcriptional regulator [Flavisolibacter sp.]MDQ3844199.1 MerR family transcriptional regulator [Bacteroidota bacterium]
MNDALDQITFEFSESGNEQREFLSGRIIPTPAEKPKKIRGRKSTKESEEANDSLAIPDDTVLFQKQYYPIGEVAQMFGVNPSLLRYWESEFGMELRKNRKGDRFFKPTDIKTLQLIYDLLRRRKFTIEGAREYLRQNKQANERYEMIQSLQRLKSFLLELKAHL